MIKHRKYRSQRGLFGGTIELQTLLVAIGIIVGVAAGGAYIVLGGSKGSAEWQTIDTLVSSARDLYAGQSYPANDLSSDLIKNNKVGNIRTNGTTLIYSNYGGTIAPVGAGGSFTVTDPAVPFDACVRVLTSIPAAGYLSVTVNAGSPVTSFRITTDVAGPLCNGAAGTGNTIAVTAQ